MTAIAVPRVAQHPPAFLDRERAAEFLGVSVTVFDEEVRNGYWPPPIMRGAKKSKPTWSVSALMARIAELDEKALTSKRLPHESPPGNALVETALNRLRARHV